MKKIFLPAICAMAVAGIFSVNTLTPAYAVNTENVTAEQSEIWFTLGEMESENESIPAVLSNKSEFAYNYRDQLDANNKAIYDALYPLIKKPSTEKINVTLPESVSVTLSQKPTSSTISDEDKQTFNNAVISNLKNGIDSLLMDNPELFWFNEFGLKFATTQTEQYNIFTGKYKVTITGFTFVPAYYDSFSSIDDVMEYKSRLEEAVENIPYQANSRYEQLKNIHDYICKFTYYELYAPFGSSVIGAIVEPGVVCEGYSKAFKLICDNLDIPCVAVLGNFDDTSKTAHMWNYVQMDDGLWYAVDVTWDDLNDDENGNILKYQYFLKGSESFNQNHTPCGDHNYMNIVYPEISETDYLFGEITVTTVTTTTEKTTTTTTSTQRTKPNKKTTTTTTESTTTTTTTVVPEKISGDLNHDGKVNVADLVYCANAVLGKETEFSCDFNEDGYTDSFDVVLMRQIVMNK
ncbi:MAG: dockerin type I domain-containing protein [Alistipes senegalensis]|nr:dockerin type I domain-containing protein [Alistipes senegalensis]